MFGSGSGSSVSGEYSSLNHLSRPLDLTFTPGFKFFHLVLRQGFLVALCCIPQASLAVKEVDYKASGKYKEQVQVRIGVCFVRGITRGICKWG